MTPYRLVRYNSSGCYEERGDIGYLLSRKTYCVTSIKPLFDQQE
jgi:hypothetical protein